MKKVVAVLIMSLAVVCFSCKGDDDSSNNDTSSQFQGNWAGTFTGDADGLWVANVTSSGVLTGNAGGLELNGTVSDNGNFSATLGNVQGGSTFEGQFSGTSGSGTWENVTDSSSGTWEGTKQ